MRVDYIEPFISSAETVLEEILGCKAEKGEIGLAKTSVSIMGVAAFTGLVGDVEGRVLFDMSRETALKIAGAMAGGEDFAELDEMARSAISELANIITGRAVTCLSALGFKFDLTPPAIFVGDNMEISNNLNTEALIVPIAMEGIGELEVNVVIRERI